MSKLVIFNDVHVTKDNIAVLEPNFYDLYHRFCDSQKEYKLVFAGDWFDARSSLDFEVAMFSRTWIQRFKDIGCQFIAGNHDKKDLDSDISWLDIFSGTHTPIMGPGGHQYTLLSYYRDEKYLQKIAEFSKYNKGVKQNKILVTHIGIDGVINETGVKKSLFKDVGFDIVISGHYHNRSVNECGGVPIIYPGSFIQANFGEDEDKGYCILDTKTLGIEYVRTNFPVYKNFYVTEAQLDRALKSIDGDVADYKRVIVQTGLKKETNLSVFEKTYKDIRFDFVREIEVGGKKVNLEFGPWCKSEGIDKPFYEKADLLLKND